MSLQSLRTRTPRRPARFSTAKLPPRFSGFTLIELLVVVLIIGILAAIAVPTFLGQRRRAQDSEALSALKNTQAAIMTVLAGEFDLPRPIGALVNELSLIEPAYDFVAVDPLNPGGPGDPDVVGSVWDGDSSQILVWYGSVYAAKASASGMCFATRMLEATGEWQWLRFDPDEVRTEGGDPMPCGGLEFISELADSDGLVWTDDPQGSVPAARQEDEPPTGPGSGVGPGDDDDSGSGEPVEEGVSVSGDFPANLDGTLGAPWEVLAGEVFVSEDDPATVYVDSVPAIAVVDTHTSEGELVVSFYRSADQAVYLRLVDDQNWVRWRMDRRASSGLHDTAVLEVSVNGAVQKVATFTHSAQAGNETLVRLIAVGDKIHVFDDAVSLTPIATATVSQHQTASKVGFGRHQGSAGSGFYFTGFSFTPLTEIFPAPVRNLFVQDPSGPVTLAWQSSLSVHVDHYKVLRNGSSLGTTPNLSFKDNTASDGATYIYAVVAVDVNGNESSPVDVEVTVGAQVLAPADDFDRADGPLGATSDGNASWSVLLGDAQVYNNRATAAAHPMLMAVNTGQADGEVQVDVRKGNFESVYLRVVDADNWLRWQITSSSGAGTAQLQVSRDGVVSSLIPEGAANANLAFTTTGSGTGAYVRFRAQMSGNQIGVFRGAGDSEPSYFFDVPDFTDATMFGLGYDYTGSNPPALGAVWFDNFSFTPASEMEVAAPYDLVATNVVGSVSLSWSAPAAVAFDRFEVHRDGQVLGTTSGSTFTDNDVASGGEYTYEVFALNTYDTPSAAAVQPVKVASGAIISVEDDFSRPPGSASLGVTSDGSASWMVVQGVMAYNSSIPAAYSLGSGDNVMVVEAGASDGTFEADARWWSDTALYLRWVDEDNWVRLRSSSNTTNSTARFELQVSVGGVVATDPTVASASGASAYAKHIKVVVDGDTVEFYRNPSDVSPATTWTAPNQPSATQVGWGGPGFANASRSLYYFKFTPAS